ncbi:MAG: leucine-rich repeat domain-containing protein [Treponema sp.]|jgi:hypothetical protein|nr:leucine-rich repeat domain-containing protein [Treponema sp.]
MKKSVLALLALPVLAGLVLGGCGNPWMKSLASPLDEDEASPGLTSIEAIIDYLSTAPGDPVLLKAALYLPDTGGNGWTDLLTAIDEAGRNVALDLSACTMAGTAFDPDRINSTGKDKIVSLVLPNTAASVVPGSSPDSAFSHFTALESVGGANVTAAGDHSIRDCPALTTVNFPRAETIGSFAFYSCAALSTVNLPRAETIGDQAFAGCSSLAAVSLPSALDIGNYAFLYCDALSTVDLPRAETISDQAFYNCDALTTVNLPRAVAIGDSAFSGCSTLTALNLPASPPGLGTGVFNSTGSGTLTIHVPAGAVGNYTSVWGVLADTSANGNPAVYGGGHKRIVITGTL